MKAIIETFQKTGKLHHAYCLEGDRDTILSKIIGFLEEELQVETRGNPNIWIETIDVLTIEKSRQINESHILKTVGDNSKKFFVLAVDSITTEAQNSLLKMFEEPRENTHFFIIIPHLSKLLPTLRSRFFILSDDSHKAGKINVEEFLSAKSSDRIKLISGPVSEKDKEAFHFLLNDIEVKVKEGKISSEILPTCYTCRKYLYDRSPSLKMIAEYLALNV